MTPFMKHRGNETVGTHPDIGGADDQVMSVGVRQDGFLVSAAFILVVPADAPRLMADTELMAPLSSIGYGAELDRLGDTA